jgi:hypothetical protein
MLLSVVVLKKTAPCTIFAIHAFPLILLEYSASKVRLVLAVVLSPPPPQWTLRLACRGDDDRELEHIWASKQRK